MKDFKHEAHESITQAIAAFVSMLISWAIAVLLAYMIT